MIKIQRLKNLVVNSTEIEQTQPDVSGENITEAATTGPASGPRPASSTPAINFILPVKKELSKSFVCAINDQMPR